MTLLRKYYSPGIEGGGIPDEVTMRAKELYSTKEYFNKWLKELVPYEKELVIDMMAEFASEELARLKEENERLRGEGDLPTYDLSKLSEQDKKKHVDDIVLVVAKVMLNSFIMLGLETHIAADVINDTNGDKFKLSFVKQ